MRILAYSHRIDRTGTPILLYRLVRALKDRHEITVVRQQRMSETAGTLAEDYESIGVPCVPVVDPKRFDVGICNTILSSGMLVKMAPYMPVMWWIHEPATGLDMIKGGKVLDEAYGLAGAVVMATAWQYDTLYAPYFDRDKVTIVPYGVDPPPAADGRPAAFAADTFNIVQLGYISRRKGQYIAIRALELLGLADVHLHLFGSMTEDPHWAGYCRDYVAANPFLAERVHFLGERPGNQVSDYLAHADLTLFPTKDDLLSLSILESMHFGCPVIASDFGPISETIRHGETGLLFPVGQHIPLAEQIRLVHDDPAQRRRLGEGGRRVLAEKHSFSGHVAGLEAVLQRLAGSKAPTT